MYYPHPAASQQLDFDTRKRGFDGLDQFFGDVKRRGIDPADYNAISRRLYELQGLQLPTIMAQPASAIPAYQPISAMGSYEHADPIQAYSLPPLGNAKTREDLQSIDNILEQMQSTIYTNDYQLAVGATAHPGVRYAEALSSSRGHTTGLPPQHPGTVVSATDSVTSATPGLTPPSSAQSYTSGQSPVSGHAAPSTNAMYPNLPSNPADLANAAATASTLGSAYDNDEYRRRYGGGMLQKSQPAPRRGEDAMDMDSEGSATPPVAPKQAKGKKKTTTKDIAIDPALSGEAPPTRTKDSNQTKDAQRQTEWMANLKMLEVLRGAIKQLLDHGHLPEDTPPAGARDANAKPAADTNMGGTDDAQDRENLYPVLRAVEADG